MHEKQSNSLNLVRRVAPAAAIGVAAVSLFSSGVMHSRQSHHHITSGPEVVRAPSNPNHKIRLTSEQSSTMSFFFKEFIAKNSVQRQPINVAKPLPSHSVAPPVKASVEGQSKILETIPAISETTTTTIPLPPPPKTNVIPIHHSEGRDSHFMRANINIQPTVGNYWFGSPAIYHRFVGTAAENANIELTYQIASQEGLNNQEIACLDNTWGRESGFDNTATNPSGAGGIAQMDPDTSYINLPPAQQITEGLSYIEQRYGLPCAAEQHWNKAAAAHQGKGWY